MSYTRSFGLERRARRRQSMSSSSRPCATEAVESTAPQSLSRRSAELRSQVQKPLIERIPTTSYFPDLNVWLALSWSSHQHSSVVWKWRNQHTESELVFCRFTQLGLLRLLTTRAVMGADCQTLEGAWAVYQRWLNDPWVGFHHEPLTVDELFYHFVKPYFHSASPKLVADCYLLAFSKSIGATLVTLDKAIPLLAKEIDQPVLLL